MILLDDINSVVALNNFARKFRFTECSASGTEAGPRNMDRHHHHRLHSKTTKAGSSSNFPSFNYPIKASLSLLLFKFAVRQYFVAIAYSILYRSVCMHLYSKWIKEPPPHQSRTRKYNPSDYQDDRKQLLLSRSLGNVHESQNRFNQSHIMRSLT